MGILIVFLVKLKKNRKFYEKKVDTILLVRLCENDNPNTFGNRVNSPSPHPSWVVYNRHCIIITLYS